MRKLRSMTGQPVVAGNRRIGRVIQAELTDDLTQLRGVWIDAGLKGTRFISAEDLSTLGKVAVMADNAGKRRRMKPAALFLRAVGTDGQRLGAITGAEIDELSFRTLALELSCGLWDDLLSGRVRIRRFTLNRETGDVLIDVSDVEKEGTDREEHDEGPDHRRADRRLGRSHVRRDELADGEEDAPSGQENRPLDLGEG